MHIKFEIMSRHTFKFV